MRVIHFVDSIDPANGGLPLACVRLAQAEREIGEEVSLGVARYSKNVIDESDGDRLERIDAKNFPGFAMGFLGGAARRKIIAVALSCADVIHFHGIWDPQMLVIMRAAKQAGIPFVVSPHGMLYPYCLAQKRWKKSIALSLGYRAVLSGAAAIRCLNSDEMEAVDCARVKAPMVIVPNGVSDPVANVGESTAQAVRSFRDSGNPYFIYVGRLHPIKGLDFLIAAFAMYAGHGGTWRLVLMGPDDGERRRLDALIRQHDGIGDRIEFIGPLYDDDRFEYYRHSMAYVQSSNHETFSMSILEAMIMGKAVLITDSCHFPEVAENSAGFVVKRLVVEFAGALLALEKDPVRRAEMGEAARNMASERYQWKAVAAKMCRVYQNVCI